MALYTLVCVEVDKWIVVEDEGYVEAMRGIKLRPASSRSGRVAYGPAKCHEAELFIANRNRLLSEIGGGK
jgi:hypothetical protein